MTLISGFERQWQMRCFDFSAISYNPVSQAPSDVRWALGRSGGIATYLDAIDALSPPKGWLKITNDAKSLAEQSRKAILDVSLCLASYEETPTELRSCYESTMDNACKAVDLGVKGIQEAIDAMP